MNEIVVGAVTLVAAFFALVAGLGVLRMPDLMLRMHASTKAGTLACGLVMLAMAVHFWELSIAVRAAGVVLFLLLTAPVAAHMIGRAALRTGVVTRLWDPERQETIRCRGADTGRPVEGERAHVRQD
jgi:multicomponent Na+:H+ antiporter subunit G